MNALGIPRDERKLPEARCGFARGESDRPGKIGVGGAAGRPAIRSSAALDRLRREVILDVTFSPPAAFTVARKQARGSLKVSCFDITHGNKPRCALASTIEGLPLGRKAIPVRPSG